VKGEIMNDKNTKSKKSLNDKLIEITIFVLFIILFIIIIFFFIQWQKTNSLTDLILYMLSPLGILFNIYLLSKAKSKKQ
jgi:uncharacterized membrane protein YbhN (UPF0104 family)